MSISTSNEQVTLDDKSAAQASLTTLQHVGVLAFGAFILFMVGFSPMSETHNAAHDTRHSLAFPCH